MIRNSDVFNNKSLNIFTCGVGNKTIYNDRGDPENVGCSGVCIVGDHEILEESYIINRDSTNINSELKAIRNAIYLAKKYRYKYYFIRIYSASQCNIDGLRNYIFKWNIENNEFIKKDGSEVKNQSVFVEIINEILNNNIPVSFFQLSGIKENTNIFDDRSLYLIKSKFENLNRIDDDIDIELIRDLCDFSITTRDKAQLALDRPYAYYNKSLNEFGFEPISFYPDYFNRKKYFNLITQSKM